MISDSLKQDICILSVGIPVLFGTIFGIANYHSRSQSSRQSLARIVEEQPTRQQSPFSEADYQLLNNLNNMNNSQNIYESSRIPTSDAGNTNKPRENPWREVEQYLENEEQRLRGERSKEEDGIQRRFEMYQSLDKSLSQQGIIQPGIIYTIDGAYRIDFTPILPQEPIPFIQQE